jgi:hypothetical protein
VLRQHPEPPLGRKAKALGELRLCLEEVVQLEGVCGQIVEFEVADGNDDLLVLQLEGIDVTRWPTLIEPFPVRRSTLGEDRWLLPLAGSLE